MTDIAERARPRRWTTPDLPVADHIPEFASEAEEADFWANHDTSLLSEQGEDVTDNPPWLHWVSDPDDPQADARPNSGPTNIISLRMPPEMIEAVKATAARQQLPFRELIRTWVGERLAQEQSRADGSVAQHATDAND